MKAFFKKLGKLIVRGVTYLGLVGIIFICVLFTFKLIPIIWDRVDWTIGVYSTVRVETKEGIGSGFEVIHEGKRYLLTAKHVCEGNTELTIKKYPFTGDGEKRKVIALSEKHDLCIVESVNVHVPLLLGGSWYSGQKIRAYGFPYGEPFTQQKGAMIGFTETKISKEGLTRKECKKQKGEYQAPFFIFPEKCEFTFTLVLTTTPLSQGNSGGAVVGRFNSVVGMVTGITYNREFSLITPIEYILEFLEEQK